MSGTISFDIFLVFERVSISDDRILSVSRAVRRNPMYRWVAATLEVIVKILWEMDFVRRANSGGAVEGLV